MDNGILELARYLIANNRDIRIEAEARQSRLESFFNQYRRITGESINGDTDGIVLLQNDADKWGLELRIYMSNADNFPAHYSDYLTTCTRVEEKYQGYLARLNNNDIIIELIRIGFRIGENQNRELIISNIEHFSD